MQKPVPMKRAYVYTEPFSVRIEPELKDLLRKLSAEGKDVAEIAREAIREAAAKADQDKQAS